MNLTSSRSFARWALRIAMVAASVTLGSLPAEAQNKKNSWEVFLYFGGFFGNDIPSARQFGDITTYRTEPLFAQQGGHDPNDIRNVFTPNLGRIGGNSPPDPNYPFTVATGDQFAMPPCNGSNAPLDPNGDSRAPFFDECDNDQESRWIYNASGIQTNGEIQRDDSEFTLGLRAGYNITRHWEIEVDFGFGKQRVDLTKNTVPILNASIDDINDPRANDLADFYHFTWANLDYTSLVVPGFDGEHPNVVASRRANDPTYNIPKYFPFLLVRQDPNDPNSPLVPAKAAGETFDDVTGFVNRVFQNPTAFRNRGNQINIDDFTVSTSVSYNFNTKADSRFVPHVSAGIGRWIRNFDAPWDGEDTNFISYGAGLRFFVNEIFSFRAEGRQVKWLDDSFMISGDLENFNLQDRIFSGFGGCERDQRNVQPPCTAATVPAEFAFPNLGGGGGTARVEVEAELDDFFEFRIGFDVILGGK